MMAVAIEAWPVRGRQDDHLELAASLRAGLDKTGDFISAKRFGCLHKEAAISASDLSRA